jgi:hypothetical protein
VASVTSSHRFGVLNGPARSYRLARVNILLSEAAGGRAAGAVPGLPEAACATGSGPAQIVTAVRSPGTYRVGLRWSRPADAHPPGGAISLVPLGLSACYGCGLGAARLPFGCLFGLRDFFCFLRCMVTLRLRHSCHYKSRPTGVNPDSCLHVPHVGELRRSELSGSVGSTGRVVWCCPWGVGAYVWCCRYQWQSGATDS